MSEDLDYDQVFIQTAIQTGFMPAGNYQWCFEMYEASNLNNPPLVPSICKSQYITTYQPPTLLYPTEQISIGNNSRPILRWSPVIPSYTAGPLDYQVQVFQILDGQDPFQAFRVNQPYLQRTTPGLQMIWPFDVPLEPGMYIWTVRAFNEEGNAVGERESFAEPEMFTVPSGNLSIETNPIPVGSSNGILLEFSPKNDPSYVAYEMLLPLGNKETLQNIFNLSDQSDDYIVAFKPIMNPAEYADKTGFPVYNVWGDISQIITRDGVVLTYNEQPKNNTTIGWTNDPVIQYNNYNAAERKKIYDRRDIKIIL
jgi:hypothetical protein